MSEWLRHLGYEVTVLTSRIDKPSAADDRWVLRTFDVSGVDSVRRMLRRKAVPRSVAAESVQKPTPRWFTDVIVPDEYLLTWGLAALRPLRRLIVEREIDCIITTGPPHSTHLLPLLLGHQRPAWIVDLRDGWCFEPLHIWPTAAQRRLDATLERLVLRSAEQVIGVTRPIAADARVRLNARTAYVPNGWDPKVAAASRRREARPRGPLLDHEHVNIVYTGKLSGTRGRDPRPVFEALRQLAIRAPTAAERLRLVLAGTLNHDDERLLSELDLKAPVQHLGSLSKDGALALQREADILLLLTSPTHVSDATGKFFEYLAAGRPILALARENDAARIVNETGIGMVVDPLDVDGIVCALAAVADGTIQASYDPHDLARYGFPRLAEDVAGLIEPAIARARKDATSSSQPRRHDQGFVA